MRARALPSIATGLVVWMLGGLVVGLVLAAGVPALVGMRPYTVMSGSMRPTLGVGDVVATRPVRAADVRVDDIITFHDPETPGRLLTHRVTSIHLAGERAFIATKGDANNHAEHWTILADGKVGRVVYHLPLIGYALVVTRGRAARLMLVVIPAIVLGVIELTRIWRPRRPDPRRSETVRDAAA